MHTLFDMMVKVGIVCAHCLNLKDVQKAYIVYKLYIRDASYRPLSWPLTVSIGTKAKVTDAESGIWLNQQRPLIAIRLPDYTAPPLVVYQMVLPFAQSFGCSRLHCRLSLR
jgi:hypothetical protein